MGKETNREKVPEHSQTTAAAAGTAEGLGAFETLERPPKLLEKLGSLGNFPKLHVLDGDDFEMIKQNITETGSKSSIDLVEQPPIFIKPQSNRRIIQKIMMILIYKKVI